MASSFSQYSRFLLATVYAIAFTGWGAVWIAERINPLWMFAALAALIWGIVADRRGTHPLRPQWNRILLVLGMGLAIADWRYGSGNWFLAVVLLLIIVSAIRALSPKANRDFAQMVGLGFLQLLAASVLTARAEYALFFVAFFVLAPWALLSVTVKAELEGESDALRGRVAEGGKVEVPMGADRMLTRGILISMTLAIGVTMVITAAFFVAFPRLSTGTFAGQLGLDQPMSGLSERVQLGDMGKVLQDSSVAVRAVLEAGDPLPSENLYFRGIALNQFRGDGWENTLDQEGLYSARGHFRFEDHTPDVTHRLRILIEDLGVDLLPIPPGTVRVDAPTRHLRTDQLGTLRRIRSSGPYRYTAFIADHNYFEEPNWSELTAPRPDRLPANLRPLTRVGDEARLPAEIRNVRRTGTLDWVPEALFRFAQFEYDLETPAGEDTLKTFFRREAGHCELFATSLALMLRRAGVPAVVVNGFRGGEWVEDDGYYLVRQRNAHSWVEYYHPQLQRWLALDPTPPTPVSTDFWRQASEAFQLRADQFRLWWLDNVVDYDLATQGEMIKDTQERVRGAGSALSAWTKKLRERFGDLSRYIVAGLLIVVAAVLIGVLWWLGRRATGPRRRHGESSGPPPWMRKVIRRLEAATGRPHPPDLPLTRWVQTLPLSDELAGPMYQLVRDYERWRFGGRGDVAQLKRRAGAAANRLRREETQAKAA